MHLNIINYVFLPAINSGYLPKMIETLKTILSIVFGAAISYLGTDLSERKKAKIASLNVAYSVIRYLSNQYIQLINLKMDFENRLNLLNNLQLSRREDVISVTQDFNEDLYRIDFSQLYGLPVTKHVRSRLDESLQNIFLCDREYFNTMSGILKLNDAKRDILKEDSHLNELLSFFHRNIPSRLEALNKAIEDNKKATHEFQEVLTIIYGKKFQKIQYGDIYRK